MTASQDTRWDSEGKGMNARETAIRIVDSRRDEFLAAKSDFRFRQLLIECIEAALAVADTPAPSSDVVGADHVDKARAWDAAQASFQKGYEKGKAEAATTPVPHLEGSDYRRGVRDGVEEALQIAKEQARLMAGLAIEGLPENGREREAMEAALTRFSDNLRVTLEGLSIPSGAPFEAEGRDDA